MIIQGICVAAAIVSVEAVIESIVTVYEGTNKKRGLFSKKRVELNKMISENGPKLARANSV